VAQAAATITTTGGLRLLPDFDFASAPTIDLLIIPGGFGTRRLLDNAEVLQWLQTVAQQAKQVASVCTGALLLAKAGLLSGHRATTHWASLDLLASLDPTITVDGQQRFVSDGIITSAGVAAGIDMAFAIVESICGPSVANETARYIEYRRSA
jgi:transcriptional regulator GlxA family with amidase domain